MRAVLAALALLAACATPNPYPLSFTRADATPDALRTEAAQCRVQAMSASAGTPSGLDGYLVARAIYRDCMIGKGWTPTQSR